MLIGFLKMFHGERRLTNLQPDFAAASTDGFPAVLPAEQKFLEEKATETEDVSFR